MTTNQFVAIQFAAIKRSINNDYGSKESDKYMIKIFNSKDEAATWLCQNYEHYNDEHSHSQSNNLDSWNDSIGFIELHKFLINSNDGDAVFHWEWKRRNNFRTYRIISFNDLITFHSNAKELYSFYCLEIVKKSEIDKFNASDDE